MAQRWWSPRADPRLPVITARRAYAEVVGVFAAFFATGIVGAALLLGGRDKDLTVNGSWGLYGSQIVDIASQVGLAVVVVWLLGARRGVGRVELGLTLPRRESGRVDYRLVVRVLGWATFALVAGGIVNAALQTGHLPTSHTSAPELLFGVADSIQAGVIEELVVLAFVVVTLRQAGRPLWEVTLVALALRGSYHIYYGPGVVGILLWAALYYWTYLRFRLLGPLMVCHITWDSVGFLSEKWRALTGFAVLAVVALWITCGIIWLVDRSNRRSALARPVHASAAAWGSAVVNGRPPPGWHPDPSGANRWRWWDGDRWTEHVSRH